MCSLYYLFVLSLFFVVFIVGLILNSNFTLFWCYILNKLLPFQMGWGG